MKTEDYAVGDLDRYLRRGYAFAVLGGKITPVSIQQIFETFTSDSTDKMVRFAKVFKPKSRGNYNSWDSEALIDIKLSEIDLTPIKSGLYNYHDRVINVKRGAERQYNMAINNNSYHCSYVNGDLPVVHNPSISLPKILDAIRKNSYYDTYAALSRIRKGKRFTAAISGKFWLSVDRYSEDILIGCNNNDIVGKVKPNNTAIVFTGFEFLMESLTQFMPIGGIEDAG